jgi:prepilin-type N-terminal cleavage/methylation domain-containing protein
MRRTASHRARRARDERGFTLVEMLVAISVFTILIAAFTTLATATITHSSEVTGETLSETEARAAVDELVADLRQAYTGTTASAIESFSSTAITFDSPDRQTPFHLRRISYRLSGGNFQRQQALSTTTTVPPWTFGAYGPWATQVQLVRNAAVFQAYDANGNATTTPSAIASVVITVDVSSLAESGRQFTYSSRATLRAQPAS